MYEPTDPPKDGKDVPRYLQSELRRLSGVLNAFRYLRVSRDYDLSASATVTVPDEDAPNRGICLLATTGGGSIRSTVFQLQRTGVSNGCYILFNTYVGQEWGFGLTTEPSHGIEGRAWVDGSAVGSNLKVKNMTSSNVTFRVFALEV